ncbi:MAG: hypothetical protein ACLQU3_02325 [Limisphaerales bacterium]
MVEPDSDAWVSAGLVVEMAGRKGCEERLLSPFPLSSTAEERGIKFSNRLHPVARADSLTRGYFLKPLRGLGRGLAVNFSQTLDLRFLTPEEAALLKELVRIVFRQGMKRPE